MLPGQGDKFEKAKLVPGSGSKIYLQIGLEIVLYWGYHVFVWVRVQEADKDFTPPYLYNKREGDSP